MGNHYLIKMENGALAHVYYMKGNGICVHWMEGEKGVEILLKDGFYDFDCIYVNGEIHIVCQNSEGSIQHILYSNGEWKRKELLTGKLKLPYPKHFKILSFCNQLMFFYIIRHDGNLMLVSQILGEDGIPSVVGYISDETQKFLCLVEDENLSLMFLSPQGELERKVFSDKKWKKSSVPFACKRETPIGISKDSRGTDHLLTSRKENGKTEFLYRSSNKKTWNEPVSAFRLDEAPTDVSFFCEKEIPHIVLFTRSEVRVFLLKNQMWEESPVAERLVHRLKKPLRIILLSKRREESIGTFREGKAELIFHRAFLLKESKGEELPLEVNMNEKIKILERQVKALELKIASFEDKK